MSSRLKNCRIGRLMSHNQYSKLQTVFYPGFSRRNITSVQAPILGKKILLADKSANHVLYRIVSQIWQLLQHGHDGLEGKANVRARTLIFLFRMRQQKCCALFSKCIFGHDFVFLRTYYNGPACLRSLGTRPSKIAEPDRSGSETTCLVTLVIWHSCYCA